jgi:PASTA domain
VRSWISKRPTVAVLALVVGLAAGLGLGAIFFEGKRDQPVPASSNQPGQLGSGEEGTDRRQRPGEGKPAPMPPPTPRSAGDSPGGRRTTVPDELMGQNAEESKEDLRLSDLRGRIQGAADGAVCEVDPPQGKVVNKGSTVTLRTEC